MLSTSFEYRTKIAQNTRTLFKATMTLADGTTENLNGDSIMMGSVSFSDSVSGSGSFDIGAAIVNQVALTLNNYDRRFDDYVFAGAVIVPYIGVELESGGVEWLRKGVYGIEQPEAYGDTIGITALDNMRLLETPYNEVETSYPASLRTIVAGICSACGVTLANPDFANNGFTVAERPDNDSLTCQAVLSYAAQASGNWARFDAWGRLRLDWYNTAAFEGEDWLDGDRFDDESPYSSGSAADGGNFTNYGSGDAVDGGEIGANAWEHVFALSNATIATDDVVITGVQVTAQDKRRENEDDLEGETSLYGSAGYVLDIPDNPLIQYGKAAEAAAQIGLRVVGMRFRPFDVSALGMPWLEAGDPIILTDRLQRQYTSYATTLSYKIGSYEAIACNAESPERNKAAGYSAITSAIVELRNSVKREKTARQAALDNLADELANSSGLFETDELQEDGSTIYYMHDKPTLAESQIVWKLTANAFGISTDGGATYPYGLDVNGDAILNRIYAIGIDASYIDTGAITVRNASNPAETVFSADFDTGTVTIDAPSVLVGTRKAFADDDSSVTVNSGTVTFNSNTFVVNSTNFSVTSTGIITAKSGTVGGFTIGSTALYNGTDSMSNTTRGVYLGTDGISTSDGYERIQLAYGDILGYQGQTLVGRISPTATINEMDESGNPTGVIWHGLQIRGEILDIRVPHLAVLAADNNTDTSHLTRTETLTLTDLGQSISAANNCLVVAPKTVEYGLVHGMLVSRDTTTYGSVNLATDAYVTNALTGYAPSNHTHSGYAPSSHTHSYDSLTNKPSIPTFSLSGTTLTITTS